VRDAHRGDAPAIGEIWSAAVPYLVRTAARAAADMREDKTLRRRRWVGLVDGVVAGTATAQQLGEHEAFVTVEVHPDHGSRGLGTALLTDAAAAFPDIDQMRSVSNGDPISLAFAVRNGFLPEGEHRISFVDPAAVAEAGPPPTGLRAVTLEALPDLRMLLETYNLATSDDPSGLSRRYTMYQLRSEWWDNPDNAPGLSFGARSVVEHHDGDPSDVPAAWAGPVGQATDAEGPRRERRHRGVDRQRLHQRGDARGQRAARLRRGGDVDPAGAPALVLTGSAGRASARQPSRESTSRNPVALARTARFQVQVSAQSTTPSPRRYAAISYCT